MNEKEPCPKPFIEISIKVKDEANTLIAKDNIYNPLLLSLNNPDLIEKVKEALQKFGYDPNAESPSIKIKASMNWQN